MNPQLISIVVAVLVAAAPVARSYILSKAKPAQLAHVKVFAHVAVQAAEKLGVDAGADGPTKLNYASEVLVSLAARVGIKLTNDETLAFVHSALRDMQALDSIAKL